MPLGMPLGPDSASFEEIHSESTRTKGMTYGPSAAPRFARNDALEDGRRQMKNRFPLLRFFEGEVGRKDALCAQHSLQKLSDPQDAIGCKVRVRFSVP